MNFLLQALLDPNEHFISKCFYGFPPWAINRVHPKNNWRLVLLGIGLGFGLLFYFVSFVAFIINIRTPQIKDRGPWLLLISAFGGLAALLYMFLRNFFDIVLVCPISYYVLLLSIVLFFAPYLLRSIRTIGVWDFNKNNSARVENSRGGGKTKNVAQETTVVSENEEKNEKVEEAKEEGTEATTTTTTGETGETGETVEATVEEPKKEESKEEPKKEEEMVQVEIKDEEARDIKKDKIERAKFLRNQKIIKRLLNEWVLILFLVIGMVIWIILGVATHGVFVGIGYGIFKTYGILDPSCQKQCNSHEGWSLRIFVFVLAIMILIFIGLVVRMYNINDSFSIRNELAVLCIFSIFCVIGMFILMAQFELWWPRNPFIGYILAIQIVGAYVISLLYPLALATYGTIVRLIESRKSGSAASSSSGSGKTQITFEYVLENPNTREKFKQFLVREFSVENLMFYTEVVYLSTLDDKEDIQDTADSINDTYVQEGAPFQINIPSELRKECSAALESENVVEPFTKAKEHVESIMKTESFPRFVKSKLYKELVNELSPKKK
jgi:hypothetical protein